MQRVSNALVQATLGVGSVHFWSWIVARTRGGRGGDEGAGKCADWRRSVQIHPRERYTGPGPTPAATRQPSAVGCQLPAMNAQPPTVGHKPIVGPFRPHFCRSEVQKSLETQRFWNQKRRREARDIGCNLVALERWRCETGSVHRRPLLHLRLAHLS